MDVRTITSASVSHSVPGHNPSIGLTGIFLLGAEKLLNLIANFAIRDLDIILGLTIISHKREEAIIRDVKLN